MNMSGMTLGAYHRLAHHRITPQSNKPPILAAVYIYSRRASSSAIRRETRLGSRHTRPSYDKHLVPASQSEHQDLPPTEYLPAQERDG